MGQPVENEHGVPDSCDAQQQTTTGLAVWRCATGILSFIAAPDGLHHWAWVDGHLIDWIGPSADPPAAPDTQAALPSLDVAAPACVEPNDTPDSACALVDGMSLPGFLSAPNDTRAYRVVSTAPQARLLADLTDLPADYDLYLADPSGGLLAQSVQEGTVPESVDLMVPAGTYYIYVHVDPERAFDANDPFLLHLSLTSVPVPDNLGGAPTGDGT